MNIRSRINSLTNAAERIMKRERLVSFPTILQLEISASCNLSCTICARSEFPYGPGNLPIELIRSVEPMFGYVQKLILHGYGEPLAHPSFEKIMEIVAPYSCHKSFYSNGTLLSGRRAQAVLTGRMSEITISVDSPEKKAFEDIRMGASFDRVVSNIRKFIALRNTAQSRTPRVVIAAVAMRDNVDRLADLVDLAAGCGADAVEINYLMAYKEALVKRSLFFDRQRANEALSEVARRARAYNIETRLPAFFTMEGEPPPPTPQKTCIRPYDFAYVGYDGNVRPCCFPLLYLGNIKSEGFLTIWNGEKYRKLRREFATNSPPSFCRACLSGVYTNVDSRMCHISCETS
jgi:MoaA/NifB/PqqE/SkfB family radical SAM enzyme